MEIILSLNDALDTATFYGVNNINILCLKNQHPDVRIVARGYQVKVIGSESAITRFEQNMRRCEAFCIKNNTLNEDQILQLIHGEQPTEFLQDNLILHGVNGKSIVARSANQQRLVDAYDENDLLFAIGPAGSGKTYTAIALAVRALKNREVKLIINTPSGRRDARADDCRIRQAAIKYKVPYLTTLAAARAAAEGISAAMRGLGEVRSLQSYHASIS